MPRLGIVLLTVLAACQSGARGLGMNVLPPGGEHPTGRIELPGAPPGELRLRVASAPPGAPDVLGSVQHLDGVLVFVPRFPLDPGVEYQVLCGEHLRAFRLQPPAEDPHVTLVAVYPSGDTLPVNLLKLYLHFSGPMRRGEAYERVRLRDAQGRVVEGAFLTVEPELWNPERTRLTLLLEPGRIKRGLVPHEELGPILGEGEYTLEVDAAWRDADGANLRGGLRRTFRTVAADEVCPDPARWTLTAPAVGTREPLVVHFDEPLDHALATRTLTVEADGGEVAGQVTLADGERLARFVPDERWRPGPHRLVVPSILEDRSGNSVGRPFEVRTPDGPEPDGGGPGRSLEFTPTR